MNCLDLILSNGYPFAQQTTKLRRVSRPCLYKKSLYLRIQAYGLLFSAQYHFFINLIAACLWLLLITGMYTPEVADSAFHS